MESNGEYKYIINQREFGPISKEALKDLFDDGVLPSDCLIIDVSSNNLVSRKAIFGENYQDHKETFNSSKFSEALKSILTYISKMTNNLKDKMPEGLKGQMENAVNSEFYMKYLSNKKINLIIVTSLLFFIAIIYFYFSSPSMDNSEYGAVITTTARSESRYQTSSIELKIYNKTVQKNAYSGTIRCYVKSGLDADDLPSLYDLDFYLEVRAMDDRRWENAYPSATCHFSDCIDYCKLKSIIVTKEK